MTALPLHLTYIGGPTALLELAGLRLLTDPTFDPAGGEYRSAASTLVKTQGPALSAEDVGDVDLVLLSHDHHFDNLDHAGRAFLDHTGTIVTTEAGAARLGGRAIGLAPWKVFESTTRDARVLRITATPARHGPAHMDRGPVIGFVLQLAGPDDRALYVSGDTVWYEGVAEVARRFPVQHAILFMGAARVPELGPWHLTFTAAEGVEAARAMPVASIVPLHFEGWAHFSESRPQIEAAFRAAGLERRLVWPPAGLRTKL